MRIVLTSLLLCLAGILYAQPDCLRTQTHGVESPNHFHPTVWVCTGDTLSVDKDANGETITTIDGFWITCEEITRDLWRWYSFVDRNPAEDDNLPATGKSGQEIDKFLDILNKSTHQTWRLPTREEWLLAFRGGIFGNDHSYSGSERHNLVAWSRSNSGGMIHPVGERIANDLDIHDMSGNAAEMVTTGDSIVFLGGCYLDKMENQMSLVPEAKNHTTRADGFKPMVDFPMPPPEACGFRIVCHEPLKFNNNCERIF